MTLRTLLSTLAACSALLLTVAAPALAADSTTKAPTLTSSSPIGYYLWHTKADGFHLRTHGPDAEHDFVATLHTDGTFTDVDTVRLESHDGLSITDGGKTLVYHVHTYNFTDGLNFKVQNGTTLRLDLKLDGTPISTDNIFRGRSGKHPKHNPFTVHLAKPKAA